MSLFDVAIAEMINWVLLFEELRNKNQCQCWQPCVEHVSLQKMHLIMFTMSILYVYQLYVYNLLIFESFIYISYRTKLAIETILNAPIIVYE